MKTRSDSFAPLAGQSYRDRNGQRWWVSGRRPGPGDQYIVEEELKGSYPRVAMYVMTEPEFREHARKAELRPETADRRRVRKEPLGG